MGRLFARLFCRSSREVYLFDYFDSPSSPSSAAKAFDDLRTAGNDANLLASHFTLRKQHDQTWHLGQTLTVSSIGRSVLRLEPADRARQHRDGEQSAVSLSGLIDWLDEDNAAGCTVVAALPDDAEELLPRADVTLLAIGLDGKSSFAEAVSYYARWFRPGSLVVDLGSTKSEPLEIMCRALDRRVGVLGAHPMFGPAVTDLTGLIVAVMDPEEGRAVSPWREWFLERLAAQRLIVTPTTAVEHDDAMSFVQALTHFTLLSFAYTFVRLDQDPAELLAFRTPVFEPLLYLSARVAHLASTNPDTYRSIQSHTARPEVRTAFLEVAREIMDAVERGTVEGAKSSSDHLSRVFTQYGAPWSPDRRDRRERQRREHFLEMGARLVDGLNQLREDVVSSAGQVRAVEERRGGQPPRIVIGIVDLDLLDPGKRDIASRVRIRPINLLLGSVQGGEETGQDGAHDVVIPLARARVLDDTELFDWLVQQGGLLEKRSCDVLVPDWFDTPILRRLLKGFPDEVIGSVSRVWDVDVETLAGDAESRAAGSGRMAARVTLSIVLHPAELVATRQSIEQSSAAEYRRKIRDFDSAIAAVRLDSPGEGTAWNLGSTKDNLKRQRKKLIDSRTTLIDREVRRLTRQRVHAIYQDALTWLYRHGCTDMR